MMKLLVTVGTTPFDRLIKAADQQLSHVYELRSQISSGDYVPEGHAFFRRSDNIEEEYAQAELVISHGGAGSIFRLLELSKKIVMVPNLDRVDLHQTDICAFMAANGHAAVCRDLSYLFEVVEEALVMDFVPYRADEFTGIAPLRRFFGLK